MRAKPSKIAGRRAGDLLSGAIRRLCVARSEGDSSLQLPGNHLFDREFVSVAGGRPIRVEHVIAS
jgi:hypothetical protein